MSTEIILQAVMIVFQVHAPEVNEYNQECRSIFNSGNGTFQRAFCGTLRNYLKESNVEVSKELLERVIRQAKTPQEMSLIIYDNLA